MAFIILFVYPHMANAYCEYVSEWDINASSPWSIIDENGFEIWNGLGNPLVDSISSYIWWVSFVEYPAWTIRAYTDNDTSFYGITITNGSETVYFTGSCYGWSSLMSTSWIMEYSDWWDIQVLEMVVWVMIIMLSSFFFILRKK